MTGGPRGSSNSTKRKWGTKISYVVPCGRFCSRGWPAGYFRNAVDRFGKPIRVLPLLPCYPCPPIAVYNRIIFDIITLRL